MSDIDWNSALERLQTLFNSNNEGTDIPDIVKAVLGDEADEEFIDLVMMAMEDSQKVFLKANLMKPAYVSQVVRHFLT